MSYITLIGEDWKAILGADDRAKYLERRVGIILHSSGGGIGREEIARMQTISGNVDLAMPVLIAIVDDFTTKAEETLKHHPNHRRAVDHLKIARHAISEAADAMSKFRREPR
jgi:hypothetical protein